VDFRVIEDVTLAIELIRIADVFHMGITRESIVGVITDAVIARTLLYGS
jgi:hypothetical protein